MITACDIRKRFSSRSKLIQGTSPLRPLDPTIGQMALNTLISAIARSGYLCASKRQLSDSVARVLDKDQRARFKVGNPLSENFRQSLIHRLGALVGQPTDDDARLVQDAKGEDVAEVEIERHDNAGIGQGTIDEHPVGGTLQPQRPDVHRFVAELF